jgi:putative salt-induced outer membrane protein YdiY
MAQSDEPVRAIRFVSDMTTKLLLWTILTAGVAFADQVILKNGDRVTGAIMKKDGNALTVKSAVMGVVTIPWDQVSEIKTSEQLNVVVAGQPPQATGIKATIATNNGQFTLSGGPAGDQTVAPASIVAIRDNAEESSFERLLHPTLLELWTGTATLGIAGTLGNAVTSTFNTAVNALRTTNHDVASIYFNAVDSSATVNGVHSGTAQAVRGGWKYDRKTGSRLEVNLFNDYEYDKFQSLDLRFVLGGGLGYRVWKSKRGALALQAGVDYDHDKFSPVSPAPEFSRSAAEAYWGDDFNFKVNGSTSIVQSFRMFSNLSDTGAYRANFDLSSNTKLHKWLVWNVSVSDRYLSDPVAGRKPNDLLYTTGVGVTFGK